MRPLQTNEMGVYVFSRINIERTRAIPCGANIQDLLLTCVSRDYLLYLQSTHQSLGVALKASLFG